MTPAEIAAGHVQVIPRPDWWSPRCGIPLPAIGTSVRHTGTGKIGSGGKVSSQAVRCRWETHDEWHDRRAILEKENSRAD